MKIEHYIKRSKDHDTSLKPSSFDSKQDAKIVPNAYVITHKNCPDGCGAWVILQAGYGGEMRLNVTMSKHDTVKKDMENVLSKAETKASVFIADILPSREAFMKCLPVIQKKSLHVKIYEHHKSSQWVQGLSDYVEVHYDMKRSATQILYDSLITAKTNLHAYAAFVKATNDRDLWLEKNAHVTTIAMLHQIYGNRLYVERFVKHASMELTQEETTVMGYVKRQEHRRREALLGRLQIKTDADHMRYGVIYGEGNSSDVLNEALKRHDLEYAFLVNLNVGKVSLRSRGRFDCEVYASKHGGGGHKHASGFGLKDFVPPAL